MTPERRESYRISQVLFDSRNLLERLPRKDSAQDRRTLFVRISLPFAPTKRQHPPRLDAQHRMPEGTRPARQRHVATDFMQSTLFCFQRRAPVLRVAIGTLRFRAFRWDVVSRRSPRRGGPRRSSERLQLPPNLPDQAPDAPSPRLLSTEAPGNRDQVRLPRHRP